MFYTEEQKRATRSTLKKTRESRTTIGFSNNDILKIFRNLDPNKAHGHDMISIRMVRICDDSICKPLKLIFGSSLESGKFPSEWKKANVVQIHKKSDKQILKNYRTISLLPITEKMLKRLSFDDNLEVRTVFLDISRAFDKVWHEGLIYKVKQNDISGNILSTTIDFLSFRKQRVVLNGQVSQWTSIKASVPQGSILAPLLFLILINDLSDDLSTKLCSLQTILPSFP